MEDEVLVIPGDKVGEIIMDPTDGKILIRFTDGHSVVLTEDRRVIVILNGSVSHTFNTLKDFREFISKLFKLEIVKDDQH